VSIGAMARQRDIEHDPRMPGLVRAAVPHIGHFQIRNRGTVGGSLSHMDPAAEWPAVALPLDAVMVAASVRGRRDITADDFMIGPQMTSLEPDELLVEMVLPMRNEGLGFAEVTRRGLGDFALAGAACQDRAVVVFGTGLRPPAGGRAKSSDQSSIQLKSPSVVSPPTHDCGPVPAPLMPD
jgi:aerobic carbon-monoxide dehydrogenase medium subunit